MILRTTSGRSSRCSHWWRTAELGILPARAVELPANGKSSRHDDQEETAYETKTGHWK
jgi:hypothetical protein